MNRSINNRNCECFVVFLNCCHKKLAWNVYISGNTLHENQDHWFDSSIIEGDIQKNEQICRWINIGWLLWNSKYYWNIAGFMARALTYPRVYRSKKNLTKWKKKPTNKQCQIKMYSMGHKLYQVAQFTTFCFHSSTYTFVTLGNFPPYLGQWMHQLRGTVELWTNHSETALKRSMARGDPPLPG